MAGYILVLIILVLGGVLATAGDRIGSRVGKARLSLFNLRPRKTADIVTILTGSIISTLTLAILLATNAQLRDGLFRIDSIKRERRQAEAELANARKQKNQIQAELAGARSQLTGAQKRLDRINQSLTNAIAKQKQTQAQLDQAEASFKRAQADLQKFSQQAKNLRAEINRLTAEARQLQAGRQRLIAQRNQVQTRLNRANVEQRQLEQAVGQAQVRLRQAEAEQQQLEQAVGQAQERLKQADAQRTALLKQQSALKSEISALESNRQRLEQNIQALLLGLRRGNIAVRTGQVLATGVVRDINSRASAIKVVNQLLLEARRTAIELTKPRQLAPNQQVVQITNLDLERLVNQIDDGRSYVIRLLAAANYLEGEDRILVVPQPPVLNQVVFPAGEQIATVSLDLSNMTDEQILERLDYLFTVSNVRAKQSGVLADPLTGTVGSFSQTDLIEFILKLKEYQGNINVAVVAPETIYTSGPLKLELIALQDQRVIIRSG
jgi:uncharacterized protein (DUF3084 family)